MSPSCQVPSADGENINNAFFFSDLEEAKSDRVPPEDVRITEMNVTPYSDGKRVRVNIAITPFQIRPHLDMVILDPSGAEAATASIIEPMAWELEFTSHLRTTRQDGKYHLIMRLFYPPRDEEDPKLFRLDLPFDNTDLHELYFELPDTE